MSIGQGGTISSWTENKRNPAIRRSNLRASEVSFPQVLSQAECDQLLQLLGEERQQEAGRRAKLRTGEDAEVSQLVQGVQGEGFSLVSLWRFKSDH